MRLRDVETSCEVGEPMARFAALVANPGLDEVAAQEVVANLLRGQLLGVEQGGQRFIPLVGRAEGAGDLEGMPYSTFGGHGGCVEAWPKVNRYLEVTELHRSCHAVDGNVGWPEGSP
jgi:hypothetical protein